MRLRRFIVGFVVLSSSLVCVAATATCVAALFRGDEFLMATWDRATATYSMYDITIEDRWFRFDHTHDHGTVGDPDPPSYQWVNRGWGHNVFLPGEDRTIALMSGEHWWGQFHHWTYSSGQQWRFIIYLPLLATIAAIAPAIWLIRALRRRRARSEGFPIISGDDMTSSHRPN